VGVPSPVGAVVLPPCPFHLSFKVRAFSARFHDHFSPAEEIIGAVWILHDDDVSSYRSVIKFAVARIPQTSSDFQVTERTAIAFKRLAGLG
jgi:hypothetical protein